MKFISILIIIASLSSSKIAFSQSTEERFQDLFTTAGYATAFGAAMGAAALSFKERPENHLKYVAIGASLGFIGGSILGSYIIFLPVFTTEVPSGDQQLAQLHHPFDTLASHTKSPKFSGLEIGWTIQTF